MVHAVSIEAQLPDNDADDQATLNALGYAQELLRGMKTFQNFAVSFSIICILAGGINSFSQGIGSLGGGGSKKALFWRVPNPAPNWACILSKRTKAWRLGDMLAVCPRSIGQIFPTAWHHCPGACSSGTQIR